jgi:hypothetical protein
MAFDFFPNSLDYPSLAQDPTGGASLGRTLTQQGARPSARTLTHRGATLGGPGGGGGASFQQPSGHPGTVPSGQSAAGVPPSNAAKTPYVPWRAGGQRGRFGGRWCPFAAAPPLRPWAIWTACRGSYAAPRWLSAGRPTGHLRARRPVLRPRHPSVRRSQGPLWPGTAGREWTAARFG